MAGGIIGVIATGGAAMRFARFICVLSLTSTLGGCVGMHSTPFSNAQFSSYVGRGRANLHGAAVARTEGGQAKTCAGYPVYLAPANEYDSEGIQNLAELGAVKLAAGPAFKYWRRSACDADGKFRFYDVPAGTWFIITSLRYQIYSPTLSNLQATQSQGGLVLRKVDLRRGTNRVILTSQDEPSPLSGLFSALN